MLVLLSPNVSYLMLLSDSGGITWPSSAQILTRSKIISVISGISVGLVGGSTLGSGSH